MILLFFKLVLLNSLIGLIWRIIKLNKFTFFWSILKEWLFTTFRESSLKLVLSFRLFFLILVMQPMCEVLDQITSWSFPVTRSEISDPVTLSAGHLCSGSCAWSLSSLNTTAFGGPDQTVTAAKGKAVRFSLCVYKMVSYGFNNEVSFCFYRKWMCSCGESWTHRFVSQGECPVQRKPAWLHLCVLLTPK